MKDRRRLLKVKLKALAAEARIIRQEELKTRDPELRESLYHHRIHVVRREARASHIAYGYVRGRAYAQLERGAREEPDWPAVLRMVRRYGTWCERADLQTWVGQTVALAA